MPGEPLPARARQRDKAQERARLHKAEQRAREEARQAAIALAASAARAEKKAARAAAAEAARAAQPPVKRYRRSDDQALVDPVAASPLGLKVKVIAAHMREWGITERLTKEQALAWRDGREPVPEWFDALPIEEARRARRAAR